MTQFQNASDDVHAAKCELAAAVLRSSGNLRLAVTGWSMLPTVMPGDMLVVERVGSDPIRLGDIALFSRNRRLFAHRVVSTCEDGNIVTQGDAMPHPDTPPVAPAELLGRISLVVHNGRCIPPRTRLSVTRRIVAGTIRRSNAAARIFLGLRRIPRSLREFAAACQS